MADNFKTVLVTGAAGFIGNRVAKALLARGHRVIGTDMLAPSQDPGFAFHVADIRDTLCLAPLIGKDCDSIIHCGGISGPMVLADNPAEVMDINIRGTGVLLALARSFGLRRFVGLSSVSAYGDTGPRDLVTEDAPLTASNAYGTSKAACDLMIQSYATHYGLSAAALRIGWVYGPGRATDAIIQPVVRSAKGGAAFEMPQGGDHPIQFVHAEDVVAAILTAFEAEALPSVAYNINGNEIFTVRQICDMIAETCPGARVALGDGMMPLAEVHGRMDISRAEDELNWAPQVQFREGLANYVNWLKDHPL